MAKKASKAANPLMDDLLALQPARKQCYRERFDPEVIDTIERGLAVFRDMPRHRRPSKADVAKLLISKLDLEANPNSLAAKLTDFGWPE